MKEERPILKAWLQFIMKASGGGVRYTDKDWKKGFVYITTKNIWFEQKTSDEYAYIPLEKIQLIGREMEISHPIGEKMLVIDYDDGTTRTCSFLLSGHAHIVNTIKHQISILTGKGVRIEEKILEKEKKLIILLSLGVRDWERIKFLLGVDEKTLKKYFTVLIEDGLITENGALTIKGTRYADKIGG
jgi:helix-turn-helix protein